MRTDQLVNMDPDPAIDPEPVIELVQKHRNDSWSNNTGSQIVDIEKESNGVNEPIQEFHMWKM